MAVETRFFTYVQNNTGGSFDFYPKSGITHYVIVEAVDAAHADQRANAIGLYFNGCDDGRDCSCCGDRWCSAYGNGDEQPMVYDAPAAVYKPRFIWIDGPEIAVHYLDGRVEWFCERQPAETK